MLAYEVYTFDNTNGYERIGLLPERRKVSARRTRESVLNWAKILLGSNAKGKSILFKQLEIDDNTGRIVWVNTGLHNLKK